MAGAPSGAVASPDAASPTRGGVARKRRREADSSGHVLGATEDGGARAKRETSDPRDVVSASVPVGRGYPELCRGAVRDWPALRAWTRDPHDASGVTYPRLRELVGDREVRAMVGSERGRFDGAPTRHESVRITVSAFLDGACSEEPPNTTGVSPLCLAQIPVYDASASAAEAAETTISSAEKLGAKPFNKNAPVLQTLWDSGDVWPVPRVDATVTSGPESGGEPIRPRYVLDSANLWVSPGPIFEDANSSDARKKRSRRRRRRRLFFSSRVVAALRRLRKRVVRRGGDEDRPAVVTARGARGVRAAGCARAEPRGRTHVQPPDRAGVPSVGGREREPKGCSKTNTPLRDAGRGAGGRRVRSARVVARGGQRPEHRRGQPFLPLGGGRGAGRARGGVCRHI